MFHYVLVVLALLGLTFAAPVEEIKSIKTVGGPIFAKVPNEFTIPDKLGNFSRNELQSKALPCGSVMAAYNGHEAYSNGQYQGTGTSCGGWISTGLQWQCVEYTQRYFHYMYGVASVWPVDYAAQMCDRRPAGACAVGTPQPGYGVVFGWGTYGHTAIVVGVGAGTIDVIEQNGSPSGWNTFSQGDVKCYLAPC